jgi:hypothetical protein
MMYPSSNGCQSAGTAVGHNHQYVLTPPLAFLMAKNIENAQAVVTTARNAM